MDRAEQLYEESARLAREQGDSMLLGMAANNLGTVAVNAATTSARWSSSKRAW